MIQLTEKKKNHPNVPEQTWVNCCAIKTGYVFSKERNKIKWAANRTVV
jgi:hypothetical protein